jgi:hypothetical protein
MGPRMRGDDRFSKLAHARKENLASSIPRPSQPIARWARQFAPCHWNCDQQYG